MKYTDDTGADKLAADNERECSEASAAHKQRQWAALGLILDELKEVAWDCGEGHDSGEDIAEDWNCAARGFLKDIRDHGWTKHEIDMLLLALLRARLENV